MQKYIFPLTPPNLLDYFNAELILNDLHYHYCTFYLDKTSD